jgi:membrane protein implicated in regulation of membrane protease activity
LSKKNSLWLDMILIAVGVITLLLLFMPKYYTEYRVAGYVGVGVFLICLGWREMKRKKKEGGA